jgi:hypothetical protein
MADVKVTKDQVMFYLQRWRREAEDKCLPVNHKAMADQGMSYEARIKAEQEHTAMVEKYTTELGCAQKVIDLVNTHWQG